MKSNSGRVKVKAFAGQTQEVDMLYDPDRWEVLPNGLIVPKEQAAPQEQHPVVMPLASVQSYFESRASKSLQRHLEPSAN